MKNIRAILIIGTIIGAILFFACVKSGIAAQQIGNMTTSVTVNSVFEMSTSSLTLDFGQVDPGPDSVTEMREISVFCETNNNNAWETSISTLSPLTSGIFTIPNENFHWWGWASGGSGTWNAGNGYLETVSHVFYTAGSEDYIISPPLGLTLQFNVAIPAGQAAGVYTTVMAIKMKDTLTLQEEEAIIDVTVEVNSEFNMSASESSIDFATIDPGLTTEAKSLYVFCNTNNNKPWNVNIKLVSELTSGTFTIPNENFHWWGWASNGEGTWDAGAGHLTTEPQTFYSAGLGEWITSSPVELTLQFNVDVPQNQVSGSYASTLVLTMTE